MALVKLAASEAMRGRPLLDGPIEFSMTAAFQWPSSVSQRKRLLPINRWHTSKPDLDNLGKIITDSLNGIVYPDDRAIASSHHWKVREETPMLRIRIRTLE